MQTDFKDAKNYSYEICGVFSEPHNNIPRCFRHLWNWKLWNEFSRRFPAISQRKDLVVILENHPGVKAAASSFTHP